MTIRNIILVDLDSNRKCIIELKELEIKREIILKIISLLLLYIL